MQLKDMLLILRQDMLHDRSDRIDGDVDYLWTDTTLVHYINEAARRFARHSLCITDGTSDVTRFQTVPFQREYTLDETIIAVLSARGLGNGAWVNGAYVGTIQPDASDLGRGGHPTFNQQQPIDSYYFDVNNLASLPPGKPQAFDTDEYTTPDSKGSFGTVNLRMYPLPSAQFAPTTIQMRVVRMPKDLTAADMEATSEIPRDYHLNLLDYAAYLALRIVDHDSGDPERAADFLAAFDKEAELARREMMRKLFKPQPWGFGRNGFSFVGN